MEQLDVSSIGVYGILVILLFKELLPYIRKTSGNNKVICPIDQSNLITEIHDLVTINKQMLGMDIATQKFQDKTDSIDGLPMAYFPRAPGIVLLEETRRGNKLLEELLAYFKTKKD